MVSQFFYKLDASFIGGAIIFGALSSIIGNYFDKEKASIFGGIIILISTFLFPSTLPVEIPLGRALSIKRGFIISVISAFLIFISYFFYIDLNVIVKRIRGINVNKKNLKILSKIDPKKYVYSVIEIVGISGGIYTSYELYRLIRKVTYLGSINLTTGEVPLFLYRIELFICLYTILFLSFYLLNKYVLKSIFK